MPPTPAQLRIGAEDRYHRQRLIEWWDQERLGRARILVVGAGALGNEILKLLALLGAHCVLVYDMDRVEKSNLSRAVLFRDEDEGRPKAEVVVRHMRELDPATRARARVENAVHRAGFGVFLWAEVVLCGVDNREARIFVNRGCAAAGKPWIDGGIEGLAGVVRGFDPARGACYECTMNATDRRLVAERRSCAMLARAEVARGHVPTTAVAASLVAALQVQELLKLLHGRPALQGEGLHFDGLASDFQRVRYPQKEDCPGHDCLGPVRRLTEASDELTLAALHARAVAELGPGATLDFTRDVITSLTCPTCGVAEPGRAVLGEVDEVRARCPRCGTQRLLDFAGSFAGEGPLDPAQTLAELGLPAFDVVVARQGLGQRQAWLFDGDRARVLGDLGAEDAEPEPTRSAAP